MARRSRSSYLEDVGHELNLVPYLDIMVNLVLFMLATITSFLSFTVLNASLPAIAPDAASNIPAAMKKAQLLLMVRVTSSGFEVDPTVQGAASIPRSIIAKSNDMYDFAKLTEVVGGLKKRFPDETKVLLISVPKTRYEDIIHTMDALRESKPGEEDLFPDVTLGIL